MSDIADDMARLYQQVILRHSRTPSNAARPGRVDASAIGDNPMCGDHVEIMLARDDSGAVADIGFDAKGCAISLASADLMAGIVRGAGPDRIRAIAAAFQDMIQTGTTDSADLDTLRPLAGVHAYPSRRRCATLPWEALLQAIAMPISTGSDA